MNKKLVIFNWKMNFTVSESVEFSNNILKCVSNFQNNNYEIIVCPTYMSLPYSYQILSSYVKFGAQNISSFDGDKGSFTGEISAKMVSDYAEYVIIGHSERRVNIPESSIEINNKRLLALENNLKPIVCIGEDLESRNSGKYIDFLNNQLKESISPVAMKTIVAYEPIWSIGTGLNCDLKKLIEISDLVKSKISEDALFIYGGSVNESNIFDYLSSDKVDGVLIGSASLNKSSIEDMMNKINGD
ncbi:MAG: triose-phosphate isomerase [Chloroflexi bacterium]|nr:triose-phosphate isomerase [Chloroflexota bacterium]|tara:strand:+ start:335 stop:1066 length:732 start_codon:yes stop_codon:yes gene_type:complete